MSNRKQKRQKADKKKAQFAIRKSMMKMAKTVKNEAPVKEIPADVQADIEAGKAAVEAEIEMIDNVDPVYNSIVEMLEDVSNKIEEERASEPQGYEFVREEFEACLPLVHADQVSALNKETLTTTEWAERFNRWFTFCDAVCNLGISILHNQDAIKKGDYEQVFSTLKLNKRFEDTFLKPNKLRVEFEYKSRSIKEKYKWLAMPCLIVTDDEGREHKVAITPSPAARVWWLEILIGFHQSYQWAAENLIDQQDFEEAPYPGIDAFVTRTQDKKEGEE